MTVVDLSRRRAHLLLCLSLIASCFQIASCLPPAINFGGLFSSTDVAGRSTFALAVDSLNEQQSRDGQTGERITTWGSVVQTTDGDDALTAHRTACSLLLSAVSAVWGPSSEPALGHVRSLCDAKELPHVSTGAAPGATLRGRDASEHHGFSVSVHPPRESVGRAAATLIMYYGWKSLVLLYEDTADLSDLQDVLALSSAAKNTGIRIAIRRVSLEPRHDIRPLLKDIRHFTRSGTAPRNGLEESNVLVHASLPASRMFLAHAAEFGMLTSNYHYILTHLDTYTLDLSDYQSAGCNLTMLRLVDLDSASTQSLTTRLRHFAASPTTGAAFVMPSIGVPTSMAVLYDSVHLVAESLRRADLGGLPNSGAPPLRCDDDSSTWRYGTTLMNVLRITEINGTTGLVRLDDSGKRKDFAFTVLELDKGGVSELAIWNSTTGLQVTRKFETDVEQAIQTLENRTLRVTVYLEAPFVMLKATERALHGNDRFEGYCIDVLQEISKLRKFNYTIHVVKDRAYGAKDGSGRWNGMVGELMRGEADLAVASLTISYSRSEVIDFTVPYMHLGISILFKKPEKHDPSLFTFLSPLSLDVWIYMLASYIGVSLMLWILARFSPYEWFNPHPCNAESDLVENQFSLMNSFWFTVGSLMQQGSDLTPKAASTRLVAGMWWFFTLILISSYTANLGIYRVWDCRLAAFLTVERMVSPIESADDLAKQTRIKYGTLGSGSTKAFFRESKIQTYQRMWAFMESAQPSVFVNTSEEGINRVRKGDYAYLMESSMLEYYVERDCTLMQIGGLLDSKGYGIGLPKHSAFREPISSAILMLQEKTTLTELKIKWWKHKRGGGKCREESSKSAKHNELGLQNDESSSESRAVYLSDPAMSAELPDLAGPKKPTEGSFVPPAVLDTLAAMWRVHEWRPSVGGVFVVLGAGMALALIIAVVEFVHHSRRHAAEDKQTLCAEMCQELQFAMSCHTNTKPVRKTTVGMIDRPPPKRCVYVRRADDQVDNDLDLNEPQLMNAAGAKDRKRSAASGRERGGRQDTLERPPTDYVGVPPPDDHFDGFVTVHSGKRAQPRQKTSELSAGGTGPRQVRHVNDAK